MTSPTILQKFRVTQVQVDACHRIEDLSKRQIFYHCENSRGEVDAEGEIIMYTVLFDQVRQVLTCTCLGEQAGYTCQHMRSAMAHAQELRLERIEEQEQAMIELAHDISEEAKAAMPYTVQVDPTTCSLDGVMFEDHNGTQVPMR